MYGSAVPHETPSAATRLWFAWVCLLRVLFDRAFAERAWAVRDRMPLLPAPSEQPTPPKLAPKRAEQVATASEASALQLLALLQREGRLVDFLQQDIASFDDADIGAAVRVVHEGCRKALREHADIVPVRGEEEGTRVRLETYDAAQVKLTGDVHGAGPFSGVLRHRGWRATRLSLPTAVDGHDAHILAQAEVEL
jgi:hypothetical protein